MKKNEQLKLYGAVGALVVAVLILAIYMFGGSSASNQTIPTPENIPGTEEPKGSPARTRPGAKIDDE